MIRMFTEILIEFVAIAFFTITLLLLAAIYVGLVQ